MKRIDKEACEALIQTYITEQINKHNKIIEYYSQQMLPYEMKLFYQNRVGNYMERLEMEGFPFPTRNEYEDACEYKRQAENKLKRLKALAKELETFRF